MAVNITFSDTSGGDPYSSVANFGSASPGNALSAINIYIRHDAVNFPITDCAFYIVRYAGTEYTGTDADDDYTEILNWGDSSGASAHGISIDSDTSHGGLYLNQNHSGSFPNADWHPFRTGYGDNGNNSIQLSANAINNTGIGSATAEEIPVQGEAHIKLRMDIPASASSAGDRFVHFVMAFSYTS